MEKSYFYYSCDINSKVGKKLRSFHHKAVKAAERADEYARKYGATSYIQPVQFFEGGVDYLEFEKEPDARIWRKRFNADNRAQYEPNCMYRPEILVLPDERFQPSDTWNRTFSREHLSWEQVKRRFPLSYWARALKYELTGDKEKDLEAVEVKLKDCSFVPFIEFYGETEKDPDGSKKGKKSVPNYLRRAIQAEKDRQALPVVETEWLFALLDMADIPTDPDERKAYLSNVETPIFFLYAYETYYIRCQCPCNAEGLHAITIADFNGKKRYALKKEA